VDGKEFSRLPIHYAAARRAPLEVVTLLAASHPEALTELDANGQTPCQLAVAHGASAEVVCVLTPAEEARHATGAELGGVRTHWNALFAAANVWEVEVPLEVVREAAAIFSRCELRKGFLELRSAQTHHGAIASPAGVRERFFGVRAGRAAVPTGDEASEESASASAWSSDVCWMSVDDQTTYDVFEALFTRCGLDELLGRTVGVHERLRLYSAFFVVRSRCDAPNFHVDYSAGCGCCALTLITPVGDYQDSGAFELLYESSGGAVQTAEAEAEVGGAAQSPTRRYVYRLGRAIVFGASFRHSTEPGGAASADAPRVYLCFTFGTDRPEHWPLISQTIDSQSRVLARPDGALVLSALGERLKRHEPERY
jgi:hypothetical protein